MISPVSKLFRPSRNECIKYETNIMEAHLTDLRIKIQSLQKQFLVQSSENATTDDNAIRVYEQ